MSARLVASHDPILWRRARPVRRITLGVRRAFDQMAELMQGLQGIGIAAPQIGVGLRLCIVDDINGERVRMVNPAIVWRWTKLAVQREGCLSFPGVFFEIERPGAVTVDYLALDGLPHQRGFSGLPAACAQHEIDHLDGVLFHTHAKAYEASVAGKDLAHRQGTHP